MSVQKTASTILELNGKSKGRFCGLFWKGKTKMEFTINTIAFIFIILGSIIVGVVIGYFVSRKLFSSQLEKNPPITKDMIKAMYRSMGRTPSEAQLNATMKAMENARKNSK